jgi:type II secretory pathway predicted ATPase ExeA
LVPVWIIDEAQNLPLEFFRDLPAFLNFAFDTRDVMSVWLIGHPALAQTLERGAVCGAGRGAFRYACSSNRCSNASALRN